VLCKSSSSNRWSTFLLIPGSVLFVSPQRQVRDPDEVEDAGDAVSKTRRQTSRRIRAWPGAVAAVPGNEGVDDAGREKVPALMSVDLGFPFH